MKLSPHFDSVEFACKCSCGFDTPAPALLAGLESLRSAIGNKPITVTSGCRCPAHNKAVGGAPGSLHVKGMAADIKVKGMSARALYAAAKRIPTLRGFGVDDARAFLHVDSRLATTRWCYRDGKHGPWYEPPSESA